MARLCLCILFERRARLPLGVEHPTMARFSTFFQQQKRSKKNPLRSIESRQEIHLFTYIELCELENGESYLFSGEMSIPTPVSSPFQAESTAVFYCLPTCPQPPPPLVHIPVKNNHQIVRTNIM